MEIFQHQYDLPSGLPEKLEIALRKIQFTRRYTLTLIEDLTQEEWLWMPESFPTHIAWQVGHIAMSHYGLTLFRQRGRDREVDSGLMSGKFRKLFMKGTVPDSETEYPDKTEIMEVLDRVYQQTLIEVPTFGDQLDEPAEAPHAGYGTKYGSLLFAADHEMLHAGQVGMLRRLMGKDPLR